MEILAVDEKYQNFIETHERELIKCTSSFLEVLIIMKYEDVIDSQEFNELKASAEENEQIRNFYLLLSKKGTEKIDLILKIFKKTSNIQVLKLLERFRKGRDQSQDRSLAVNCNDNRMDLMERMNGNTNGFSSRTQMDRRFHMPVFTGPTKKKEIPCFETPLTVKVNAVSTLKEKNKHIYSLRSQPRGHALIVSYGILDVNANCIDSSYLCQLFHGLGFRCTIVEDLEEDEFGHTMFAFKKKFARTAIADCCVVVVLNHKCQTNNISTVDGGSVDIIQDAILHLSEENCPELKGKPKLFFLQGFQNEYFKDKTNATLLSQKMKDTLIVSCTSSENESSQIKCKGSHFVYQLTKVLMENACSMEFSLMMNLVKLHSNDYYLYEKY